MKTISINLYSFDELSEAAKQYAIEKQKLFKQDWDYLDSFTESANDQIFEAGFSETKIQYILSCSKGDGLSFSSKRFDNDKLKELFRKHLGPNKEKTINEILNYCTFKLTGNNGNHYCYASKNDLTFEFDDYKANKVNIHTIVSYIETDLQNIYLDLCKELEGQGYEEIEYQFSDECIIEDIQESEHEFTEEGNIY
jgi:hypothetical protein